MAGNEFNFMEFLKMLDELKNDVKQLLSIISKNKNALNDVRRDFKRFLEVMDRMTREENMRTFRKFVNELERFNKNAEKMSKELEEMKNIMKGFGELAKMLKGD